jgi:hypothetical protein
VCNCASIIPRVARCGVSLGRAPSDRAQKLIGCHSRARWGRADGEHGGGDALPRQVRSGVHRGVYSPKMFFSPAASRASAVADDRRSPRVSSFASTSSLTRAFPPHRTRVSLAHRTARADTPRHSSTLRVGSTPR